MKTTHYLSILLSISLAFLGGCGDEEPVEEAVKPSNLVAAVSVDSETEGLVHVEATADNVNFFRFQFEEDGEQTSEDNETGKASYQYTSSGTYKIIAAAHTLEDIFVEQELTVDILFDADTIPDTSRGIPTSGYSTPESYDNYDLAWQDEFDGESLNTSNWNYETGTGNNGWGNSELQYYREENTSVSEGVLTIEAKQESFGGSNYTSSRITTQGKQEFKYGRIDIRAAMPKGKGLWPALWMLGDNFSTIGWPKCGEIDIMEMVGGDEKGDRTVYGTIHWDDAGTKADYGQNKSIASGTLADEFHVYSIIWDESSIKWLLDDKQYNEADITPANLEEFHNEFFFIFNVAVGGDWPGSPDESTAFPQRMYVDYVRVFQEK